jgi:hypothetical protein
VRGALPFRCRCSFEYVGIGGAVYWSGLLLLLSRTDLVRVSRPNGLGFGFLADDGADCASRSPDVDADNSEVEGYEGTGCTE